jgi:hypothetical protein
VNKNYLFLCPDAIHLPTDIFCSSRSNVFSGSVRNYLFSCSVGIHTPVSIAVSRIVCVNSYLVVIALSVESKSSNQPPYLVIFLLEMRAVLNVTQIGIKIVANASKEKVEYVRSYQYAN